MKFIIQLFILVIISRTYAQANTDVFLFNIKTNTNTFSILNGKNISNNEGYDNQPSFKGHNEILFASTRNGQTDIAQYYINYNSKSWINNTEGSEYTPLKIPNKNEVSAVRLDSDGKQRLYSYNLPNGRSTLLIKNLSIAYYTWYNKNTIVSAVIEGDDLNLFVSNLQNGKSRKYATKVGRSFHKIPGSRLLSFISKENENQWQIKALDPITGITKVLTNTIKGTEDICWLNNKTIVSSKEANLYKFTLQQDTNWKKVADLSLNGISKISRLAINSETTKLLVVGETNNTHSKAKILNKTDANPTTTLKKHNFTKQDTLRGSITPERKWWDLTYYHLDVEVKPDEKFIFGKNTIQYKVIQPNEVMQIDLQPPMQITKVTQGGKILNVTHNDNVHFIQLLDKQKTGTINTIKVHFKGKPKAAIRAPWDGGFSWKKDKNGNHFIATSCQGIGASVWWPNKDHMYDEVDSMLISVTHPKGLTNISNGRLRKLVKNDSTITSHWFVDNPINNYGVNINIADYANFSEIYNGEKGDLDMDYWVLSYNLKKAKKHFKDAPKMMEAFEHWFGPYPFYDDSFKLVEVPYLGMEHQSSVTYGNQYKKGYLGTDLSQTGWGLKFDFIIVHEGGHEWFANSITNKDIADMWIHESFTAYSENLFLDYHFGKEASADYVIGTRANIINDSPLIGHYNVNNEGSSDMYYKGANMLHTLRQLIEDDEKWRQILRGLNATFYHQTVTTKQIENYISKETGYDLTAFFNQYLRDVRIPTLEYKIRNNELKYRWTEIVNGFDMPIQIEMDGKTEWIFPKAQWKTKAINTNCITIDRNFYVYSKALN